MQKINDSIRAAVRIENIPERARFSSFEDMLNAISNYLSVEIPPTVTGVVSSSKEPDKDSRDKLWLRRDGSGGVLGIYYYAQAKWQPAYTAPDGTVQWIIGDSGTPPEGFKAILEADDVVDSTVVETLKQRYISIPNTTRYKYYAARFIGFKKSFCR